AGLSRAPVGHIADLSVLFLRPCRPAIAPTRRPAHRAGPQPPLWSITMSHSTGIETNGVEQIPDDQRDASPLDLFRLIFGGANTFATAVLGSFPVLFGLSFQAGVWAILLGVGLGALILAPMGLFGALNGTNNAVSSGAHF